MDPRAISAASAAYAISTAPSKRILGARLHSAYELRQLEESDLSHFDEDVVKNYHFALKKTQALSLVVARKAGTAAPLFAMVCAKTSSKKRVLVVRVTGITGGVKPEDSARLATLCLAAVLRYALLTETEQVRVRQVTAAQAKFLEKLGFVAETVGHHKHASLYLTHHHPRSH